MIQHIIIKGLFHKFNYDIPLNSHIGNSITFLTGCNGMGKTTILNMVEATLTANFDFLFSIPFDCFELQGNDYSIELIPIPCKHLVTDEDNEALDTSVSKADASYSHIDLKYTSELLKVKDSIQEGFINDSLKSVIMFLKVEGCYHIQDSRISFGKNEENVTRIGENCSWLKMELLNAKDNITQALMPLSTIDYVKYHEPISDSELINLYWQLVEYEIFPLREKIVLEEGSNDYQDVVQTMRRIYPAICSDKNFLNLLKNLSLFKSIIKSYSFIDKELEISARYGFRFKTMSDHLILNLDQLSSGEKHLVIQLFELLFRASIGSVILIDEPEISLHPSWQMDYLSNLEEIAKARSFQCLVATHQPMIFGNNFNRAVDLYKLSYPDMFN